jgi:hypothetical protein
MERVNYLAPQSNIAALPDVNDFLGNRLNVKE